MGDIFIYGERGRLANYVQAVERVGGSVVCSLRIQDGFGCSGLLLPGGGDVDPRRYGQDSRGAQPPDLVRDEAEFALIETFLRSHRPILGICRGIQGLNVALGGTLIQDLPGHAQVEGRDLLHDTQTVPGSFVASLYGRRCVVNSAHHQAIDRLGDGLRIVERAQDGVAEAVEHGTLPVWGVQWHPERLRGAFAQEGAADGEKIFSFFWKHCR